MRQKVLPVRQMVQPVRQMVHSVRQMVQLEEINPLDTHDDSLVSSLCRISDQKQVKAEPDLKKTPPKWAERARKYSCHFCWKTFVVKRDWEGHINSVHLRAKPFRCHICSWSSAHRGELQKHVKKCARLYGHLVRLPVPVSTISTGTTEYISVNTTTAGTVFNLQVSPSTTGSTG